MGDNQNNGASFASRGITLNSLKDELYSLNMRMLLAMQNHNDEAQEEIMNQIADVQKEIDRMSSGYRKHE